MTPARAAAPGGTAVATAAAAGVGEAVADGAFSGAGPAPGGAGGVTGGAAGAGAAGPEDGSPAGAGMRCWAVPAPVSAMWECSTSGGGCRYAPSKRRSAPVARPVPRTGTRKRATSAARRSSRDGGVEAAHICRRTVAEPVPEVVDTRQTPQSAREPLTGVPFPAYSGKRTPVAAGRRATGARVRRR